MNNSKVIAFFDVDNTIFDGYTQRYFIKFLYKSGYISLIDLICGYLWFILYKLNFIREIDRGINSYLKFFKGVDEDRFKDIVEVFFKGVEDKIFKSAEEDIYRHINLGHEVVLISTSLEPIVDRIGKVVKSSSVIATKLEVEERRLTGKIAGKAVYGATKLTKVKEYIDINTNNNALVETYFYSDHHSDYPLLMYVNNPIVVNPDNKLYTLAIKNNWEIKKYKK